MEEHIGKNVLFEIMWDDANDADTSDADSADEGTIKAISPNGEFVKIETLGYGRVCTSWYRINRVKILDIL